MGREEQRSRRAASRRLIWSVRQRATSRCSTPRTCLRSSSGTNHWPLTRSPSGSACGCSTSAMAPASASPRSTAQSRPMRPSGGLLPSSRRHEMGSSSQKRQRTPAGGPFARHTLDADRGTMPLHNRPANREAQSDARPALLAYSLDLRKAAGGRRSRNATVCRVRRWRPCADHSRLGRGGSGRPRMPSRVSRPPNRPTTPRMRVGIRRSRSSRGGRPARPCSARSRGLPTCRRSGRARTRRRATQRQRLPTKKRAIHAKIRRPGTCPQVYPAGYTIAPQNATEQAPVSRCPRPRRATNSRLCAWPPDITRHRRLGLVPSPDA